MRVNVPRYFILFICVTKRLKLAYSYRELLDIFVLKSYTVYIFLLIQITRPLLVVICYLYTNVR